MLYVKNVIFMIYKVWIFDRERKEKEIYDLFFLIFKIRRGGKKIGFCEMCFEYYLLVDL